MKMASKQYGPTEGSVVPTLFGGKIFERGKNKVKMTVKRIKYLQNRYKIKA
jgi:hypothetical protein